MDFEIGAIILCRYVQGIFKVVPCPSNVLDWGRHYTWIQTLDQHKTEYWLAESTKSQYVLLSH